MPISPTLAQTRVRQVRIVRVFRAARAVTGATARSLGDLGLKPSRSLTMLVDDAVVRRAGATRYYLDETAWAKGRNLTARSVATIALAAAAIATVVIWWAGR